MIKIVCVPEQTVYLGYGTQMNEIWANPKKIKKSPNTLMHIIFFICQLYMQYYIAGQNIGDHLFLKELQIM